LKTGRVETREGLIAPLFTFRRRSQLDLGDGLVFTEVEFFDRTGPGLPRATERRWDFGDGISAAETNPRHVYLRGGVFRVTLTQTDAATGSSGRITRVLDADILFHQGHESGRAQRYLEVVERYDFAKLGARDLERVFTLINQVEDAGAVEQRLCEAYAALGDQGDARARGRSLARLGEICLVETENFDAAKSWYRQLSASAAVEDQREAWFGLGAVAVAQNDAAAAQSALAEAKKRANPWDAAQARRLALLEGDIARIQGKRDAALKAYRRAAESLIGRSMQQDELLRHAYPPRVQNFLLRREYRQARQELADWAERFPQARLDGYYTTLWQRVQLAQKHYRGAAQAGDAFVACCPGDTYAAECLYLAAVAKYGQDDDAGALERMERLIKDYPESDKRGEAEVFMRKLREK
ncbi:MAG: PKD domain-containing protein, partial [Gemmatimonadetes bacterium]|nr:PKD domain-containing protein [Gemmatimonadota bacterium]